MTSLCLRLSEALGREGADRDHMLRTAYASGLEAETAMRLLVMRGGVDARRAEPGLKLLDEVRAMIWRAGHR